MKNNYPDSLTIQQYLDGKLDPEVAHQLEKQALDDPFLWDALEGYSVYRDPAADLSILQRQLHERIVHAQENKKVFDLSWQRLSVAAAAAVMFVSAGILFWMNSQQAPEQLASQSQKPVEVNVIDRDSVEKVISTDREIDLASLKRKELHSKMQTTGIAASDTAATVRAGGVKNANDFPTLKEARVIGSANAPASGWSNYREYLKVNTNRFSPEPRLSGSVLLSFHVGPDGTPENIKVVKGLNEVYNKEAVRILRSGSGWKVAPNGNPNDSQLEVEFR